MADTNDLEQIPVEFTITCVPEIVASFASG